MVERISARLRAEARGALGVLARNRFTLADERDRFGLPVARVTYS